LIYADEVNIVGEKNNIYIYIIKKNTQALIDASKKLGLEVNQEKTKYMLVSRTQKLGKWHRK
jgi:hypothetical protein